MYLNNHNTPIISPNNSTFTLLSIHKYKPNKASTSRYQLVNNVAFSLSIQCGRAKQIYQCTKRGNKNTENGNSMPCIYMLIAVTQIPNVVVLEIIILDNMAEHQFKYPAVRSA